MLETLILGRSRAVEVLRSRKFLAAETTTRARTIALPPPSPNKELCLGQELANQAEATVRYMRREGNGPATCARQMCRGQTRNDRDDGTSEWLRPIRH